MAQMLAVLREAAQRLPEGPERWNALREIDGFQRRLAALVARPTGWGSGGSAGTRQRFSDFNHLRQWSGCVYCLFWASWHAGQAKLLAPRIGPYAVGRNLVFVAAMSEPACLYHLDRGLFTA
jgi:hypothetical protein